jgi:uncharacterized protein (TIGR00304 family)
MDLGTLLVFAGFLLVLAGTIVFLTYSLFRLLKSATKKESKAAGVIIIGPIPIIFGEDRKSLKLAIALSLLGLALTLALVFLQLHLLR